MRKLRKFMAILITSSATIIFAFGCGGGHEEQPEDWQTIPQPQEQPQQEWQTPPPQQEIPNQ